MDLNLALIFIFVFVDWWRDVWVVVVVFVCGDGGVFVGFGVL